MTLEEKKSELKDKLIELFSEDYSRGMVMRLDTVEKVQEMIDYINDGHTDEQDLIIVSLILAKGVENRDENGVLWI